MVERPEMPIFKCVEPLRRERMGWAFYCLGELLWFPTREEAEEKRRGFLLPRVPKEERVMVRKGFTVGSGGPLRR